MDVKSNAVVVSVLSTLQGLDEMGGVDSPSEYIEAMEFILAEVNKRLSVCRKSQQDKLSDRTREEAVDFLRDRMVRGMFGDGMEEDYVTYGTTILGLVEMTDEELVMALEQYTGDDEELVMRANAELGIEDMLNEEDV